MEVQFGLRPGLRHYGCIVHLLGKAGYVRDAYEFVKRMPVEPDLVLWRSLLSSCKVHGDVDLGEEVGKIVVHLHPEMMELSEDYVALSNIYASAERWKEVETVRKVMKVKGVVNKPGSSLVQGISNHIPLG
ncbi:unnamed protein product [Linum tenue]|nr:unnamed protein product [Linum tenue]